MAPADTPRGKKARENQFFDPGVRGRKTGITLKDTGIRDEHGLEPLEGIFSSPEKQSAKPTARKSNGTVTTSEDMEVVNSSAPEPTEVLTGRRLARNSQGMLQLPTGRSPIKTNLGATPRRGSSVGPQSNSRSARSVRASSHPTVARRLDFSVTETGSSVERPRNGMGLMNGDRDVFDLPDDDEDGVPATIYEEESEMQVDGTVNDSFEPMIQDDIPGDETAQRSTMVDGDSITIVEVVQVQKKKPGRKRKSDSLLAADATEMDEQDGSILVDEESQSAPVVKKRRGRPPRVQPVEDEAQEEVVIPDEPEGFDENSQMEQPEPEENDDTEKAESSNAPKTRGRKKKTPAERDPNAKIVSGKAKKAAAKQSPFKQPGVPHSKNQHVRSITPGVDDGLQHTRAGRIVVKPLNEWKNEKIIYERGNVGMTDVQQIIRVEDNTPMKQPPRSRYRRGRATNQRSKKISVFGGQEDDAEEEESWEIEEGEVCGNVRKWDAEAGKTVADEEEEQQLAFAARKVEPQPSPDNPNFCFTKTLTQKFFGAGIIELPPRGYKGTKNSRRFQFHFFVHYGKVAVEIAGNRFVITKGGMWQVPRGNFYSITNETDKPARIVFAQGCEPDELSLKAKNAKNQKEQEEGEGDTSVVTAA